MSSKFRISNQTAFTVSATCSKCHGAGFITGHVYEYDSEHINRLSKEFEELKKEKEITKEQIKQLIDVNFFENTLVIAHLTRDLFTLENRCKRLTERIKLEKAR